MSQQEKQVNQQLINQEHWKDILKHFIDVLKVNIFIVDCNGKIILPSSKGRYGGDFWENKSFSSLHTAESDNILARFEKHGHYLECKHHFGLHSFAIAMNLQEDQTIAYMIVGPISLNKRLDSVEYQKISEKFNINYNKIADALNEIRIVSFINMKSILDLLREVSKYILQLSFQEQKFHKMRFNKEILPPEISEVAQDIYSSICLDELLVTLLDVALNMTRAESGSIMILDKKSEMLTIKVSRGIDVKLTKSSKVRIGEGISGLAAKENTSFLINGLQGDNRIKHLLKRPQIKHALVMPLCTENNVFGVLNLHTKFLKNRITKESLNVVQNLSRLTSAAISSIQQHQPNIGKSINKG